MSQIKHSRCLCEPVTNGHAKGVTVGMSPQQWLYIAHTSKEEARSLLDLNQPMRSRFAMAATSTSQATRQSTTNGKSLGSGRKKWIDWWPLVIPIRKKTVKVRQLSGEKH